MTWAHVAHRGSANTKTAGATLGVNPSAAIAAGRVVVVRIGSGTGGVAISSVTDSQGNTYSLLGQASHANATGGAYVSQLATALGTGDTITVTWAASTGAKSVGLEEFSVSAGSTISIDGTAGTDANNTNAPVPAVSGLSSIERLFVGAGGFRDAFDAQAITQDADYGPAGANPVGTTGGATNSNAANWWGFRVATITGDTWGPTWTTARPTGAILRAVAEIAAPAGGPTVPHAGPVGV